MLARPRKNSTQCDCSYTKTIMNINDDGNDGIDCEVDPQETEELELKGDALNDGMSECRSDADSRFALTSRTTPSPRASLQSQRSVLSTSLGRRRGRNDATSMKTPASRQREGSGGSVSPADSRASSPTRSIRSVSTAAPSADPRGDQELLQLMDVGDPLELTSLDLSFASKKTKRVLKSLQSLCDFVNLTELNVSNNGLASLDGVDLFVDLIGLNCSRNHIKRIDAPLFTLVTLQALDLSGNFISHIPRGITALEVLEVLNLSGNNLSALKEIDVLGKLANLHACNLAANPFCKLPTYKDYAVSKLLSLERLDDSIITDQLREKSRRRFSEDMFSKDKYLRDADIAHASEQSKLREMQLALEAENLKLKGELQLKSKLLQNKSKAWSNATEQLLQLQQDLAMMNLDRRHGATAASTINSGIMPYTVDNADPTSNQPELGATSHNPSCPPLLRTSEQNSSTQQSVKTSTLSKQEEQDVRQRSQGNSPVRNRRLNLCNENRRSPTKTALVDAACSPFPTPANQEDSMYRSGVDSGKMISQSPKRVEEQCHGILSSYDCAQFNQGMPMCDADDDANGCDEHMQMRPSLRFPTFEDDSGCPAYDDPSVVQSTGASESRLQHPLASHASHAENIRARVSSLEEPSQLHSPRSHRMWERQRAQLAQETSKGSPKKTPQQSQVLGLVEKENLVRQIQALQSCKQSFLIEIAREEQLLHELKREGANYTNHIECLESDMQILVGATTRGGKSTSASQQREEETMRAKLEMLRNKLHYAEDKEGEIEATIVRMTKRILEEDLQHAKDFRQSVLSPQPAQGHFDKEIFALTHNLQLAIVEKEEIHAEMSRLMNQLRNGSYDDRAIQQTTGLSAEALLLIDQHDQLQRVSAESQTIFVEKQKKVDEYKRRLRDVQDRIKIKEDLLASLVAELKDVESELEYINELTPKTPGLHRRSLSLDSVPSSAGDTLETTTSISNAISPRALGSSGGSYTASRRRSSSLRKDSRSNTPEAHESISNMVEAAAADVNSQFEQKFKELFSPEVLESIKQDIYDKLSRQFQNSTLNPRSSATSDQLDLQRAIATALDIHMKKAMESFDKQREDICQGESSAPNSSPKKPTLQMYQSPDQDAFVDPVKERRNEPKCWDEVDDFMPIPEATYAAKYRFTKVTTVGALSPSGNDKCPRSVSAQRIQKAGERLNQVESECRIDTISGIETDTSGKKKSDLKVVIMGARDLPTAHLRTKNLDPYVALEIVYPQHVRPQAQPISLRPRSPSVLSQGRHVFLDEPTQLPNQSFRSRTVKKSVYPVWDEEFEFAPVHSLKGYLHVRVLNDRKLSREQLVGEVKIPLRTLVDQKKIVDSFVLSTSSTTPNSAGARRSAGTSKRTIQSGTIRIQLQLTFSRIEKLKRALDDLVTRHIDEYNQFPPFIERINGYEGQSAAPRTESSLEDSHDGEGVDASIQPLPTYESWKAQQPASTVTDPENLDGGPKPSVSIDSQIFDSAHSRTSSLSTARSAALWATPSTVRPVELPTKTLSSSTGMSRAVDQKDEALRIPPSTRQIKPTQPSSRHGKKLEGSASAKAAMSQLRQLVNANKSTQAMATLQNAGTGFSILHNGTNRRKTTTSAVAVTPDSQSPDCFDDYSPYHPDFQLLDPLGIETMSMGGNHNMHHPAYGKTRSTSYSGGLGPRLNDPRRTDLRIFKSPGFSRREPSGGFPERFIGLDTQTSERIKRIFGRIDSQA